MTLTIRVGLLYRVSKYILSSLILSPSLVIDISHVPLPPPPGLRVFFVAPSKILLSRFFTSHHRAHAESYMNGGFRNAPAMNAGGDSGKNNNADWMTESDRRNDGAGAAGSDEAWETQTWSKNSTESSNNNSNRYSSGNRNVASWESDNRALSTRAAIASPLGFSAGTGDSLGVCGLRNLGNTCYMNSGLQCLMNLPRLRHYILDGRYRTDINLENVLGHQGTVAETFADLVRRVWNLSLFSSVSPSRFKTMIGGINRQFAGFGQQDAQEFLAYLLDGLHEVRSPDMSCR